MNRLTSFLLLALFCLLNSQANARLFGGSHLNQAKSAISNITPINEGPFGERGLNDCWPGFEASTDQLLDTCCWYNQKTCCSPGLAAQIMPQFQSDFKVIYSELGKDSHCYAALASFICLFCAPDTAAFISGDTNAGVVINLCSAYCDTLYFACKNDLQKLFPNDFTSIKSGDDFCAAAFASDPDTSQGESVAFDTSLDADCFAGYDLGDIENSGCLPGIKPPAVAKSKRYEKVIGALSGIIAMLILVIAGFIGVLIFKYVKGRKASGGDGRGNFSLLTEDDDSGIN